MKSDYHTYAQGRYDSRTSFTEIGMGVNEKLRQQKTARRRFFVCL